MKIQLDTTNKVIKIEESVNLNELFELLNKILPEVWKEFKLEVNIITNFNSPIIIKEYPTPYYPWWQTPIITYGTSDISYKIDYLADGTYNIQY